MSSKPFITGVTLTFAITMSTTYLLQRSLDETAPSFHQFGDGADTDTERNALRYAAWNSARELRQEPCSQAAKQRYIEAATAYIRARNALAPCLATKTCGLADQWKLAALARIFRTKLDDRVSEAMADAHVHTLFRLQDFPADVRGNVEGLTHDPNLAVGLPMLIRPGVSAECS